MACQCGSESKYKCPACREPYCSVACFKLHKTKCTGEGSKEGAQEAKEKASANPASAPIADPVSTPLTDDPEISRMLKYDSLRNHLKLVATILEDASISREQTSEGRQLVALKKLRELRKGGREENELVEEFCLRVSSL